MAKGCCKARKILAKAKGKKPSIRDQVEAHRKAKGFTPSQRKALATTKRAVRSANPRDLKVFAAKAHEAAEKTPAHHRFGSSKAYIHKVHEAYEKTHGPMHVSRFKRRLVEAHNAGHVELSRADQVEAMPEKYVKESHTTHPGGATFNFMRLRKGR